MVSRETLEKILPACLPNEILYTRMMTTMIEHKYYTKYK